MVLKEESNKTGPNGAEDEDGQEDIHNQLKPAVFRQLLRAPLVVGRDCLRNGITPFQFVTECRHVVGDAVTVATLNLLSHERVSCLDAVRLLDNGLQKRRPTQ